MTEKWSKKKFVGEWAKTLQTFLKNEQDIVPKEWLRPEETLRRMGFQPCNSGQRSTLLKKMVDKKFLEQKTFRILDSTNRRLSPLIHYKLNKK